MNEEENSVEENSGGNAADVVQPATAEVPTASDKPTVPAETKTLPIDPSTARPEQLEEFYNKVRPASADDYELTELGEDEAAFFKKQFFDNKLTKQQGEALVKAYKESIQKAEAPLFSADGFKTEMTNRFGENYQANLDKINGFVKAEAAPEDAQLIDKLPNSVIGIVYSLIDKVMTRYAVNDTDTAKNGGGNTSNGEPDYTGFVVAMQNLRGRPHDSSEVIALKKQYNII